MGKQTVGYNTSTTNKEGHHESKSIDVISGILNICIHTLTEKKHTKRAQQSSINRNESKETGRKRKAGEIRK